MSPYFQDLFMFNLRVKVVVGALACVFANVASAQLPAAIKVGHPRLYTSEEGMRQLKALAYPAPAEFPAQAGKISFTLTAQKSDVSTGDSTVIFGWAGSPTTNAILIRHLTSGGNGNAQTIQIGLQQLNSTYVGAATFPITVGVPTNVSVVWDSARREATAKVGEMAVLMKWNVDWKPDQQLFQFGRRAGERIENFEVIGANENQSSGVVAELDFPMLDAWRDFTTQTNALLGRVAACHVQKPVEDAGTDCNVATGHRVAIVEYAQNLALAYKMTRDTRYRDGAFAYADKILAAAPSVGGEFSMGGRVGAMAILYDWLHEEMKKTVPSSSDTYLTAMARRIKETIAAPTVKDLNLDAMICGSGRIVSASNLVCGRSLVFEDWNRSSGEASISQYYISGHHFSGVSAIASALLAIYDDEHRQEVRPLLETAYSHFEKGFLAARAHISANGGNHLGWAYGVSSIPERLLMWRSALADTGGAPIFSSEWSSQLVYPYIYGLRNTKSYLETSDSLTYPASGDNFDVRGHDTLVAQLALWAADNANDASAWAFYKNQVLPSRVSKADMILERLYWPRAFGMPDEAPAPLPLSRHFSPAGQVVMRDSWDYNNATLLEFKSSSFASENHQHLDQNSFSLYYKAPLLVDSGVYDSYGSPHWQNYYTRSIAHNTITVFNKDEVFKKKDVEYSNDGGQWFSSGQNLYPTIEEIQAGGANSLVGVTGFEQRPDAASAPAPTFTYVSGNASKAYSASKMDQTNGFVRSIVFLNAPEFLPRKPVTIVFDRVLTTKTMAGVQSAPMFAAKFLLHTANEPAAPVAASYTDGASRFEFGPGQSRIVTVRNGPGLVTAQTLLPVNAIIAKVGGMYEGMDQPCQQLTGDMINPAIAPGGDCRFAMPWRPSGDAGPYKMTNFAPGKNQHKSDADVGAWRLEVTAPSATFNAPQHFLHVLTVGDNDDSAPPATPAAAKLLPSKANGNTAALLLGAGSEPQTVVVFNRHVGMADGFEWTSPLASVDIIATGLAPNANFTLAVVAATDGQFTFTLKRNTAGDQLSSNDGVLFIKR